MAMTYTILTGAKNVAGSLRNWTNYTRFDPATIIEEAELLLFSGFTHQNRAMTGLRVREMRTATTVTLAIGDSTEALPTRFLEPILMRPVSNVQRPLYVPPHDLLAWRTYTDAVLDEGTPAHYAVFDELIQFDRKADEELTYSFLYYARPEPLASAETNFLTTRYPQLLRTACCYLAAEFEEDDTRSQRELGKLAGLMSAAAATDELSFRGMEIANEVP